MKITVNLSHITDFTAPQSKSVTIRALITASFASMLTGMPQSVILNKPCEDVLSAIKSLDALGFKGKIEKDRITFCGFEQKKTIPIVDTGSSAAVLRFLIPTAKYLYDEVDFVFSQQLGKRPIEPILECLSGHGVQFTKTATTLHCKGHLSGNIFHIDSSISSQFISGLLLGATLFGGEIHLHGDIVSSTYIDMTNEILREYGGNIRKLSDGFTLSSGLTGKAVYTPEGDMSATAMLLTAGIIGNHPVTVHSAGLGSLQGDRMFIDIVKSLGGRFDIAGDSITAYPGILSGGEISVKNCPDLYPALRLIAEFCEQKITFTDTNRLIFKESDRIQSTEDMLYCVKNGLTVNPQSDHRIAMAAGVASAVVGDVTIENAECVNKSFPDFFEGIICHKPEIK